MKKSTLLIMLSFMMAVVALSGCAKNDDSRNEDAVTSGDLVVTGDDSTLVTGESNDSQESDVESSDDTTVANDDSKDSNESDKSESKVREFNMNSFTTILSGQYFPQYSVKAITVKKGDKVKITIKATSGTHDFNIDEFNVHSETPLDEETEVEFTADKAGTFIYYCSKPGHRANGHRGTLTVTE